MPDQSLIEYAAEYAGLAAPIDCTNRPEVWGPMLVELYEAGHSLLAAGSYGERIYMFSDFTIKLEPTPYLHEAVVAAHRAMKEAERGSPVHREEG